MSLAECTSSIFSALSTVTCVPGGKPILLGACAAALCETVNNVSMVMRCCFTARKVR